MAFNQICAKINFQVSIAIEKLRNKIIFSMKMVSLCSYYQLAFDLFPQSDRNFHG